jgi:hypothetical protein
MAKGASFSISGSIEPSALMQIVPLASTVGKLIIKAVLSRSATIIIVAFPNFILIFHFSFFF